MKKTIFFVEDDKSIHALIMATLELNGYEVEGFADPLDFLAALKRKVPDLVVLDLMLPHMSGYDVIAYMRGNKRYANIPIIILSALSDELDIVMGLEHGAVDYISKPFGVLEFASRIKANLQKLEAGAVSRAADHVTVVDDGLQPLPVLVDHGDVVGLPAELVGEGCADLAAADDHDVHAALSLFSH